jgi:hypothetical protein
VNASVTNSMIVGTASNARNLGGLSHPAIKPPKEHTSSATELGKKYSSVSTG